MIIADEIVISVFVFMFLALMATIYFIYNVKRKSDIKIAEIQNPSGPQMYDPNQGGPQYQGGPPQQFAGQR
jgi:hypothetical protein